MEIELRVTTSGDDTVFGYQRTMYIRDSPIDDDVASDTIRISESYHSERMTRIYEYILSYMDISTYYYDGSLGIEVSIAYDLITPMYDIISIRIDESVTREESSFLSH
jgi:hypothetical protein